MKISVIGFSRRGCALSEKICRGLQANAYEVRGYAKTKYAVPGDFAAPVEEAVVKWTKERFRDSDALVFVGACGIAVRSIAPYVESKKTDPAVIVVDEHGRFAISLLSGHLGGANELAEKIAALINAQPVVTTATDLNERFAVDVFAKKNGCRILDMTLAKEISAALLAGEPVGFYSEFPWNGKLPDGLKLYAAGQDNPALGICVAVSKKTPPFERTLYLTPRIVTAGIGCRKNTPEERIAEMLKNACDNAGIFAASVWKIASIDLKKEEPGLAGICRSLDIPFEVYPAEALAKADGEFSSSDFVKTVTGVDNVCERAALLGSSREGKGRLILKKYAQDGVTVALALKEWSVTFE